MMKKGFVAILVLITSLVANAQTDVSQKLQAVMDSYQKMRHYKIEIYTQTLYSSEQRREKPQKAGTVIRKGDNFYVQNDQKEIFQCNGKRIEVDNGNKVVVYYPVANKQGEMGEPYQPNWEQLDQKKNEVKMIAQNGGVKLSIPVKQFNIESIDYLISKDNLLTEMVYHYKATHPDEIQKIRVIYKNDLSGQLSNDLFSFRKILTVKKDGTTALTKQYNNFQFINTSSYETQQ